MSFEISSWIGVRPEVSQTKGREIAKESMIPGIVNVEITIYGTKKAVNNQDN
jgi:hypothetical protein